MDDAIQEKGFSRYSEYSGFSYTCPLNDNTQLALHPGLHGTGVLQLNPYIGLVRNDVEDLQLKLAGLQHVDGFRSVFTVAYPMDYSAAKDLKDFLNPTRVFQRFDSADTIKQMIEKFMDDVQERRGRLEHTRDDLEWFLDEVNRLKQYRAYKVPILLFLLGRIDDASDFIADVEYNPKAFNVHPKSYAKFKQSFEALTEPRIGD